VKRASVFGLLVVGLFVLLCACIQDRPAVSRIGTLVVLAGTPTPTPTVTPICPTAISSDTTWGPGTVRVQCNVGVMNGVTLTISPGTSVLFVGHHKVDVKGSLYAVGTVTEPITLTHETAVVTDSWGCLYLRGDRSTLHYVNVYYGGGINDAAGSELRYCTLMTNTYGLALPGPKASDVASCTMQHNDYGVLAYANASPVIERCNVLSSTVHDIEVRQPEDVTMLDCWWGADPPDEGRVWDDGDDFTLGVLDRSPYATGWITW
jgi:hypothetical protein